MHIIPSHQSRPADDPIFALNREASERRARGEAIVNATVGALLHDDGRLAVLPSAAAAVHEVPAEEWAAYAPIAGTAAFQQAVLDDFFRTEPGLRRTALASATPGGSGAIHHALTNYLDRGQALLTASHYWGPYQTLCDESDRTLATFPMFTAGGQLDAAALEGRVGELLASQGRVLLLLNDPCHNPTGYSMTGEEWQQVVSVLLSASARGPVTLLVDTAYFAYARADPFAFLVHLRPLLGRVGLAFAWSASKSFTHYGLRVGALLCCVPDDSERRATEAALSYASRGTWSNCNRGGMQAIARLLTVPALRAACDEERGQLQRLLGARVDAWNRLARPRGLDYPRYDGGFFVTVFSPDAMARAARMRERGVYAVPSREAIRVALCSVAERDIPVLVEAIAAA